MTKGIFICECLHLKSSRTVRPLPSIFDRLDRHQATMTRLLVVFLLALCSSASPLSNHGIITLKRADCESSCAADWSHCNSWCYGEDDFSCGGSCDRSLESCLAVSSTEIGLSTAMTDSIMRRNAILSSQKIRLPKILRFDEMGPRRAGRSINARDVDAKSSRQLCHHVFTEVFLHMRSTTHHIRFLIMALSLPSGQILRSCGLSVLVRQDLCFCRSRSMLTQAVTFLTTCYPRVLSLKCC